MPFLDSIDVTKPNGATEPVAVLDDYAREMRVATKDTVAVEHALTGEHRFLRGTTGSRPAPSVATDGRIYFNTTDNMLQMVVAGAWTNIVAIIP